MRHHQTATAQPTIRTTSQPPHGLRFNVSGHPAVTLPAGLTPDRLPAGIQLIAGHGHETLLYRLASALELTRVASHVRRSTDRDPTPMAVCRSQTGTQDLIRVVRSCRGVGEKPGQESRLLRINFPGVTTEIPFTSLPLDQSDVRYLHGPDSGVQEGVPSGTVTEFEWNDSAAYLGTSRRFWVYVPA